MSFNQSLAAELAQVKELVMQLVAHFDQPSLNEFCKSNASKMLLCIEKSINYTTLHCSNVIKDPLYSGNEVTWSDHSVPTLKYEEKKEMCKKRKIMPKWTTQVRLSVGGTAETSIDDGFSWRKYGQKDILGSKQPRAYFRCTHRTTRGCQATKQVQRSDYDPLVIDITYNGTHSCNQSNQNVVPDSVIGIQNDQQQEQRHIPMSFRTGIEVKDEYLDCATDGKTLTSFSVGSSPVVDVNPDNVFCSHPTTESVYFSPSMCQITNSKGEVETLDCEFDFSEMSLLTSSPSDSPVLSVDFLSDFVHELLFDPSCYLE